MARHAVIVGGGATGVAVFITLVTSGSVATIDIIDPFPPGKSRAFSVDNLNLLCNTSVDTMSIIPSQPHDFLNYLRENGIAATPADFVPRIYFSQYVQDRYNSYCLQAKQHGIKHHYFYSQVKEIHKDKKRYHAILSDNQQLFCSDVFLCMGFGEPKVPSIIKPYTNRNNIFINPILDKNFCTSLQGERVLLIGTRLSAIDCALLLCPTNQVTMTSTSGLLPAVRTRTLRPTKRLIDKKKVAQLDFSHPSFYRKMLALIAKATYELRGRHLSKQLSHQVDPIKRLKEEVALAAVDCTDWQDMLVDIVDAVNDELMKQPHYIQQQAMKRCDVLLSRYLGAFPLENAKILLQYLENKQLALRKGLPSKLYQENNKWCVVWDNEPVQQFDVVICAAGYQNPFLQVDKTTLSCGHPINKAGCLPEVSMDQQVFFAGQTVPERIWVVGMAAYLKVPLVNAIYPAVRQAGSIGQQFG